MQNISATYNLIIAKLKVCNNHAIFALSQVTVVRRPPLRVTEQRRIHYSSNN